MSWVTVAAIVVIFPYPAIVGLALVIAASFTLLLLAHLVTLMVRVARLPAALPAAGGAPAELRVGRRAAVVRLGQAALWTAVFGLELFWTRRKAESQTPPPIPCEKQPAFGPIAFGTPTPVTVTAENAKKAERMACDAAADAHCSPFSTTTCPFCRVKTGEKNVTCTATCTEVLPATKPKTFSCTGTVSATGCDCRTK